MDAPAESTADDPLPRDMSRSPTSTRAGSTDSAGTVDVVAPPPTAPPPPPAMHRRTDTVGSAVTDGSGELRAARRRRRVARTRGGSGGAPSNTASTDAISAADNEALLLAWVAGPDAARAHAKAHNALQQAARFARQALALARADGAPRAVRRAWVSANINHRAAVTAAEHVRLWAAAHRSAAVATDVDVRHGSAALPPFHALEIVASFGAASRARRRLALLVRAVELEDHLVTRQTEFLELVRAHAAALPLHRVAKSKSFS